MSKLARIILKYIPPITSSPKLPENRTDIQKELSKQESLLAQIHTEMNAGFVSKRREEQLWEVSRIITQLKRKLRSFEKRQDTVDASDSVLNNAFQLTQSYSVSTTNNNSETNSLAPSSKPKSSCSDDESTKTSNAISEIKSTPTHEICLTEQAITELSPDDPDKMYIDQETQLLMVPESHPQYLTLIRLQLENNELLQWKSQLQTKINSERTEILRLKKILAGQERQPLKPFATDDVEEYEKIINNYIQENKLLEHKKNMLAQEIFEEKKELIQLQVELALKEFSG